MNLIQRAYDGVFSCKNFYSLYVQTNILGQWAPWSSLGKTMFSHKDLFRYHATGIRRLNRRDHGFIAGRLVSNSVLFVDKTAPQNWEEERGREREIDRWQKTTQFSTWSFLLSGLFRRSPPSSVWATFSSWNLLDCCVRSINRASWSKMLNRFGGSRRN